MDGGGDDRNVTSRRRKVLVEVGTLAGVDNERRRTNGRTGEWATEGAWMRPGARSTAFTLTHLLLATLRKREREKKRGLGEERGTWGEKGNPRGGDKWSRDAAFGRRIGKGKRDECNSPSHSVRLLRAARRPACARRVCMCICVGVCVCKVRRGWCGASAGRASWLAGWLVNQPSQPSQVFTNSYLTLNRHWSSKTSQRRTTSGHSKVVPFLSTLR